MKNISNKPPVGKRVMAYRNLRDGCWSLKSLETGRVLAHLDEVFISDALFRVSEAGRQRVLRERSKNVHAGVVGRICERPDDESLENPVRVRYNPYQAATFFTATDGVPVHSAPLVHLDRDGHAHVLRLCGGAGDHHCREQSKIPSATSSV